jgi:hypothetical protein
MSEHDKTGGAVGAMKEAEAQSTVGAYEPPRLVAIGSLHDLLAGSGTLVVGDALCKSAAMQQNMKC